MIFSIRFLSVKIYFPIDFLDISKWVKARKVDLGVDLKLELYKMSCEINKNIQKSDWMLRLLFYT